MDQWREWIRDLRQEGYSKQEIQNYLEEEGYNPEIVHAFWDDEDDSFSDLSYISHDYMTVETMSHGLTQLRPGDYTDAVVNILSSPEGTIRRSDMSKSGMFAFVLINSFVFLIGSTIVGSLISLFFDPAPLPQLLGQSLADTLGRLQPYLVGGIAMTIYLAVGGRILGEGGRMKKIFEAISYGTLGLVFMWVPVVGPLFGFLTLYIWLQAIKEVHRPMTRMRGLVLIGIPALLYLVWLGNTALTTVAGLFGG